MQQWVFALVAATLSSMAVQYKKERQQNQVDLANVKEDSMAHNAGLFAFFVLLFLGIAYCLNIGTDLEIGNGLVKNPGPAVKVETMEKSMLMNIKQEVNTGYAPF